MDISSSIRVLIVDNHPMLRRVVAIALADSPGMEIVGEAGSGPEAIEKVTELQPDVVVLDLGLPGMDGLQVLRRRKELSPRTRVVVLTAHDEPEMLFESMRLDVAGYLHKGIDPDEIQDAIERAGRGESAITPQQQRSFMHQLNGLLRRSRGTDPRLSEREIEVLTLLTEGRSNREIGRELHLSNKTVETHVSRIYRRLGVTSRLAAVDRARELKLIEAPNPLYET